MDNRQLRAAFWLMLLVLIPLAVFTSAAQSPTTPSEDSPNQLTANRRAGRPVQTLYQIQALAAAGGWTAELNRMAGDTAQQMDDLARAVSYWEAAQASVEDVAAARKLAESYLTLQRWQDALRWLRRLAALIPAEPWAHYHLGLLLAAANPQEALVHLRAAAVSDDYTPTVSALIEALETEDRPAQLRRVGVLLMRESLWPYAELAFQQEIASAGVSGEALAYIGLARDRQGKNGSAWLAQAALLEPENPRVLYLQGLHLRFAGDDRSSLSALARAFALDSQNPALAAEVGRAYQQLDNLVEAEAWLQRAVLLSDGAAQFQEMLAVFYAEEAQTLTTISTEALQALAAQFPDNSDVRSGLGWALHITGQTDAGLAEIDRVLSLAPTDARALFYKARILLEIGQTGDAAPLLEFLAEGSSPFAPDAQRMLRSIR